MPKMFTEEMAAYFKKAAESMYKILEKVIHEYQTNAEYRKLFGFDEKLEKLILRPNHYECALPIARIDIFFNEDDFSFKFCEFNADGSSAMNEDKELNQAIRLTSTFDKFTEKYNVRTYELFNSWVKAFMDIYRTYDRAVENPHIAIVDFFGGDISREFTAFQKAYEDSGLTCEICEITDLSYENGKLLSPSGKQINAIYRRAVTCDIMRNYDKVQPFIKAAENNDVCLIGDFKTQVIHNKIVFKVIHDDMTSAFLTDEEKQYVFGWAKIAVDENGKQLVDRQNDLIDPEELEQTAYTYVEFYREAGEMHERGGAGVLIESIIITKEKMKTLGIEEGTLPEGWWVGFHITDDEVWAKIKDGTYTMFSIEGKAKRIEVEEEE